MQKQIADEFGIFVLTVLALVENRKHIEEIITDGKSVNSKMFRRSKNENVDTALLGWFQQACAANVPVNGPVTRKKTSRHQTDGLTFQGREPHRSSL